MADALFLSRNGERAMLDVSVERPRGALGRCLGLMGRAPLAANEGMWLARTSAIHTFAMRAAIDVVFLATDGRILRLVPNVAPNRPFIGMLGASGVLELAPGSIQRLGLQTGDALLWEPL